MSDFFSREFKDLKVKLDDGILVIGLDNQKFSNAFSDALISSFVSVLEFANFSPDVRVIILTGEGKNFCAGGDVKAMQNKTGMFAGESYELRERYASGIQRIPLAIEALKKPIIAMVNGAAIGAGCDLAAMCDIRICDENSRFGETFTKLALVPGDGGPYFLARVIGYTKAMEMYLTGDIYSATQAKEMGLVYKVCLSGELLNETMSLARRISKNAPIAIEFTKMAMKRAAKDDLQSHLNFVSLAQGITQRSDDHFKAIDALLTKTEVEFERK
ncbi:enoyl-CoA hydratase-related protein [Bacteriovorax sp. Seq25_V]|uniref:enoyl-CoA hydratase-related protein n=1 Tax=Bacteriovorax sp. Seq25_V TaxID=1201288 RepID=UPI000389FC5E|nr:enoyl-CoA hydratase-related protein [Bacteriovorax sp. Seq25_V]EQC43906.1 enoyl-CoA hydratase/isomerase family protein [Bacteriovorax sp. Seq25_V]